MNFAIDTIVGSNKISVTKILIIKENCVFGKDMNRLFVLFLLFFEAVNFSKELATKLKDFLRNFVVNLVDFVLCLCTINAINCVFVDSKEVDDLLSTLLAFVNFHVISRKPLEILFTYIELIFQKIELF
jgi:hypothetical protein